MQYQPPRDNSAAPPRTRLTYSTQQQQAARGELFANSQYASQQDTSTPVRVEDMDNQQIMQHAVATHKDTTATAKRALQIIEQTKEIQVSTQAALQDQGDQMCRIETDMDKIGEDLSYSERILRFMKMCCCFSFFCACCTEPTRNENDKHWRGPASQARPMSHSGGGSATAQAGKSNRKQQAGQRVQQAAAYPGVSTQGLADVGFQQEADELQAETQQQDKYLDQISNGLDQLKEGAKRMNEELSFQQGHVERIARDTDVLETKLHAVNRKGFKSLR